MSEQLFSASSIATFLRCGKQWEYAYVYSIKSPPNLRIVLGLAAHEAVEYNFQQKQHTTLDLEPAEVVSFFSDAFDRMAVDVEETDEEEKEKGKAKDSGVLVIEKYQDEVAPTIQPLYVEQEIQFKIDGLPYSGFIDLVDQDERVRDLKTTARKPGTGDYALAMTGYAVGYRQLTGHAESSVMLDYMVRTKQPYYYPVESNGPISQAGINAFGQIIRGVSDSIQHGIFLPTGLKSGACSWCGYRMICPAYQAAQ